jgi:hypothetical protein
VVRISIAKRLKKYGVNNLVQHKYSSKIPFFRFIVCCHEIKMNVKLKFHETLVNFRGNYKWTSEKESDGKVKAK